MTAVGTSHQLSSLHSVLRVLWESHATAILKPSVSLATRSPTCQLASNMGMATPARLQLQQYEDRVPGQGAIASGASAWLAETDSFQKVTRDNMPPHKQSYIDTQDGSAQSTCLVECCLAGQYVLRSEHLSKGSSAHS